MIAIFIKWKVQLLALFSVLLYVKKNNDVTKVKKNVSLIIFLQWYCTYFWSTNFLALIWKFISRNEGKKELAKNGNDSEQKNTLLVFKIIILYTWC